GHDDAPALLAAEDQRHRRNKALVEAADERAHRVRFDLQHLARHVQRRPGGVLRYHRGKYSPINSSASPMAAAELAPILILLAAAVLPLIACRCYALPPILGYLAAGLALGPHALGLVPDDAQTHALAEVGV